MPWTIVADMIDAALAWALDWKPFAERRALVEGGGDTSLVVKKNEPRDWTKENYQPDLAGELEKEFSGDFGAFDDEDDRRMPQPRRSKKPGLSEWSSSFALD